MIRFKEAVYEMTKLLSVKASGCRELISGWSSDNETTLRVTCLNNNLYEFGRLFALECPELSRALGTPQITFLDGQKRNIEWTQL
jgi:hypothetical protein